MKKYVIIIVRVILKRKELYGGDMKGIVELFKVTTRLPVIEFSLVSDEKLGKSMKFYPFVGIILGIIMYSSFNLLSMKIDSQILLAIFNVVLYIVLTGAIQLNGLSNTFGNIFRYRSKQKMLDGMKEGKNGTNGVLALIIYFFLNVFLLSEVQETFNTTVGTLILLYPVIGRLNVVVSCITSTTAKSCGTIKHYVSNTTILGVVFSFLITIGYTFLVIKHFGLSETLLMSVPITVIFSYLFSKLINKKIGGATEDTLGATVELSQIIFLFLAYFII